MLAMPCACVVVAGSIASTRLKTSVFADLFMTMIPRPASRQLIDIRHASVPPHEIPFARTRSLPQRDHAHPRTRLFRGPDAICSWTTFDLLNRPVPAPA